MLDTPKKTVDSLPAALTAISDFLFGILELTEFVLFGSSLFSV